jgi:hypothetical protein
MPFMDGHYLARSIDRATLSQTQLKSIPKKLNAILHWHRSEGLVKVADLRLCHQKGSKECNSDEEDGGVNCAMMKVIYRSKEWQTNSEQ